MDLTLYQIKARETRLPTATLDYALLGFAAEAGEVLGKVAKHLRDGGDELELRDAIKKELGDCLWFIAAIADGFDLDLNMVAETNLAKLKSRQQRGVIAGSGDDR